MTVAIDATVLIYLVDAEANAPIDEETGKPVANCPARVESLLEKLQRDRETLIIPTPALAEVLVRAGTAGPEWIRILSGSRHFRIVSFDERAAVEFAAVQAARPRVKSAGAAPEGKI